MQALVETLHYKRLTTPKQLLRSTVLIFLPTLLLAAPIHFLGHPLFRPFDHSWGVANPSLGRLLGYLDVIVFTPLVENALTLVPLLLLKKTLNRLIISAAICGVLWGALHGAQGTIINGIFSSWTFFCISVILYQSERSTRTIAWLRSSLLHGAGNAVILGMGWLIVRIG